MNWLNYHHLLYFWTVAREGTITRACDKLYLAQPTISAQIRALEQAIGHKLFRRDGRNLVLTDTGRVVFQYAEEIFALGQELTDTLAGRPVDRPQRLVVGIADSIPKLIAYRLIEPALHLPEPVQVICREEKPDRLVAQLAVHGLDIVLSDTPLGSEVKVRAFNHALGESGVSIFGTGRGMAAYRRGFPRSLDGAPFLLPASDTALRRSLDGWFESKGIRPTMRGEFDDSALLNVFGQAGAGLFAMPTVIEKEVQRQYQVQLIGRLDTVRERFYAISVERRLKHAAVVAISEAAREKLFG